MSRLSFDAINFRKLYDEWKYRNFGPTTLHLKHEAYLLVSLTFLTMSSLHSLYRSSFGLGGDFEYTVVTFLWLSRSLVLRCICAWDTSTHRWPTLRGVFSHWFASHLIAGQFCDRPHPYAVASQLGLSYPSLADDSRRFSLAASAAASPATILTASSSRLVMSVRYTWQFFLARIWHPLLRAETNATKVMEDQKLVAKGSTATVMVGQSVSLFGSSPSRKSKAAFGSEDASKSSRSFLSSWTSWSSIKSSHPYVAAAYSYLIRIWSTYSPPFQMVLLIVTVVYYIRAIFFAASSNDDPYAFTTHKTHALIMHPGEPPYKESDGNDWQRPYGAWRPFERPSSSDVIFYASCGGTLACLWLYDRLVLPLPDLVAGSNVLKAVRFEARMHGSNNNSAIASGTSAGQSGVGVGGVNGIIGGTTTKSSKSKLHKDQNADIAWAETKKSISAENRFRLVCKVISVRTMEYLFVCAFLPRSSFACRATGHCSGGMLIWALSKILYPAGTTSTLRDDGGYQNQFSMVTPDRTMALLVCASVLVVTISLLLAQAVALQRTYLSTMGFIAGEWSIVDESDPILQTASPSQWDPRRRYKKGDLILQNYPKRAVYRATSNSPEGRPFDLYLRATHDLFRNELGHPASSKLVLIINKGQMSFLGVNILVFVYYWLRGYHLGGIIWILAANFIAAHGVVGVSMPRSGRLKSLAKEINA